uniref:F-box/kelch-repeat protein At1g16250 n=1 Tax=Anthurium amnicola TaxID=1678845 RepID=A0A1D1YV35_9ARAE
MEEYIRGDLIPGLPDDLALICLSRISHGYHGILECVSRRWRDTFRSTEYSGLKAREGWCGNWLFVLTDEQHSVQWNAYDPEADKWHPLPMTPKDNSESSHCGFSCVTVCKKFLVLGGYYVPLAKSGSSDPYKLTRATNDVFCFDPFDKQWSRVTGMRTPRYDFACSVLCGKVFVAGGSDSSNKGLAEAEVYDILKDKWEDLPSMPAPLVNCFSISYDDRFHVIGRNGNLLQYYIFDPSGQSWKAVEDLWQFYRLKHNATTVLGDCIYAILDEGLKTLKISDAEPSDWSLLDGPPFVELPGHSRKLQPTGYGFIGFRRKLYLVGGKGVKYDSDAHVFDIVKFDFTRYCEPGVLPLEWREARAMFRSRGTVIGCAFLEE